MIEQRYVIKFLLEEGDTGIEIHRRLTEHYRDRAMSRSEVYRWARDIKGGRTDLETISSPGRTPDEGLADVIRKRIDEDPHLSARKIAQSLGIATSTVCHYLRHVIGMKCCHLRWVPHTLTVAQKVEREDLAKRMLEVLAKHAISNFHFLFTGDESWLLYAYHVRTMWTLCPENVDETQRPSHRAQKTMLTVFFNGDGLHLIDILPQNQKMNAEYFAENIVPSLVSVCYPDGRRCRARKCVVHFDNAPIHNSKLVTEKLMEEGLKRMPHPAYSPDLSPCDFFLFGYLKDKLIDKEYTTPEELFTEVETIISEIPSDMISRVFLTWQERLRKCIEMRGNYIE